MWDQLLNQFLGSSEGSRALQTLQQQHGLSPTDAQHVLGAATSGTAEALATSTADAGLANAFNGSNAGNAVVGVLAGLLSGQGMRGAVTGGLGGVIAGKVGQAIAQRTGMNPQMAATVAAAITPLVLQYLQGHMAQHGAPGVPAGAGVSPVPAGATTAPPADDWESGGPSAPARPSANKPPMDPAGKTEAPAAAPAKPPWKRIF